MALSSYTSNWSGTTFDNLNFIENLDDNIIPNTFIDPFFNPDEFLYTDDFFLSPNYYDPPPPPPPLFSLPPENFDSYPYPSKRQKCYENFDTSVFTPSFPNEFFQNSCPVPGMMLPEIFPPFLEIQNPPPPPPQPAVNFGGNVEISCVKKMGNTENVSAQSIAARQRRRKITEKTQELGKLIPGGNKMNTAEMLQSAFKYVKYMQAVVGIFQSMESIKEENKVASSSNMEDLQVLLQSSTVQEKLCLEEKCIVPTEFVKVLAKHHDNKSQPSISDDLNRLLIQSEDLRG